MPDSATLSAPLTATVTRGRLAVHSATHLIREDGEAVGAVWGLVDSREADGIVARLRTRNDPGRSSPDTPWAAVAQRSDGTVAATASTMQVGGLFHGRTTIGPAEALVIGTDPQGVIRYQQRDTILDVEFIRGWLLGDVAGDATPYAGIARSSAGRTLIWPGHGEPSFSDWIGPEVWGDPTVSGPEAVQTYRDVFDEVVGDLLHRVDKPTLMMSGGLDSTFVAAAMARLNPAAEPVLALTHSPHPDAQLQPRGNWDPDDLALARVMESRYPGSLQVQPLVNTDGVQPLDAAAQVYSRSGWPCFGVGNSVWLEDARRRARERGAVALFNGGTGNAGFSWHHDYAVRYHLRRGQWGALRSLLRPDSRETLPDPLQRSVLAPLAAPLRRRRRRLRPAVVEAGIPGLALRRDPLVDQRHYLIWLARLDRGSGEPNTALQAGLLAVDPFRSRGVMDLAASLTPAAWHQGRGPRGFARAAGCGRVPDEIRLRTRRGGQSWDTWFAMRHQRERYENEVDLLEHTTGLAEWIDTAALRDTIRAWPWGQADPAHHRLPSVVNRLLSCAQFVRQCHTGELTRLRTGPAPATGNETCPRAEHLPLCAAPAESPPAAYLIPSRSTTPGPSSTQPR